MTWVLVVSQVRCLVEILELLGVRLLQLVAIVHWDHRTWGTLSHLAWVESEGSNGWVSSGSWWKVVIESRFSDEPATGTLPVPKSSCLSSISCSITWLNSYPFLSLLLLGFDRWLPWHTTSFGSFGTLTWCFADCWRPSLMFWLLSSCVLECEWIFVEADLIFLFNLDWVDWHPRIFLKSVVKVIIWSVIESDRAVGTFWLHTDVWPRRAGLVVGVEDVSESRVALVGWVVSWVVWPGARSGWAIWRDRQVFLTSFDFVYIDVVWVLFIR